MSPALTEPIVIGGRELRSPKRYTHGTHRARTLQHTLDSAEPAASAAGITRCANITGLDRIGIPVTLAIRPNSRSLVGSTGKGVTLQHAVVSGTMEAIELWHAEHLDTATVASYRDRASAVDLPPAASWGLARDHPFDADHPLEWVDGFDIARRSSVAVPRELVDMDTRRRAPHRARRFFSATSNGLAAGNTVLEACTAATYEVIERDARAIADRRAQLLGRLPPRLNLAGVVDAEITAVVERCVGAGVDVFVADLTSPIGVPVYEATLIDRVERHLGVAQGWGAHLDPAVAVTRAITEAAQGRVVSIAGSRDDIAKIDRLRWRRFDHNRHVGGGPPYDATVVDLRGPSEATASFEGDIGLLLARLESNGLDRVVVVDLSRPEFDIHVVKVIVPDAEGPIDGPVWQPGPLLDERLGP